MNIDFTAKQVWVTGAGQGIGYHIALAFQQAGAQVVGFDRQFRQTDYPFRCVTLDVADADQVARVCQPLLAEQKQLDVLVNGAGILRIRRYRYAAGCRFSGADGGQRRRRI